jgi:hypothetical protein
MAYREAQNWPERCQQCKQLKGKVNALLAALPFPEQDARKQGLKQFRGVCTTSALLPFVIRHHATIPERKDCVLRSLGLQDVSDRDLRGLLGDLDKNSKCAFVTLAQFVFENLLEQLLRAALVQAPLSFANKARKVVQLAELSPREAKTDALLLPAYIRNCLHSNGIHRQGDRAFNVGGVTYDFHKGRQFSHGTWSRVFHALSCALDVYEEVFLSDWSRQLRFVRAETAGAQESGWVTGTTGRAATPTGGESQLPPDSPSSQ